MSNHNYHSANYNQYICYLICRFSKDKLININFNRSLNLKSKLNINLILIHNIYCILNNMEYNFQSHNQSYIHCYMSLHNSLSMVSNIFHKNNMCIMMKQCKHCISRNNLNMYKQQFDKINLDNQVNIPCYVVLQGKRSLNNCRINHHHMFYMKNDIYHIFHHIHNNQLHIMEHNSFHRSNNLLNI